MKYTLNIELTEAEAITLASAMCAAQINNTPMGVGGNTSGFQKVYKSLYNQFSPETQQQIDGVMDAYKDIMSKPSFTRAQFQGATDSLKDDLLKSDILRNRKGRKGRNHGRRDC